MPPKGKKKPEKKNKKNSVPKNNRATISEEKMKKIQIAKEERSLSLFYKMSEPEAEEETLEQKISRKKKELKNNTF